MPLLTLRRTTLLGDGSAIIVGTSEIRRSLPTAYNRRVPVQRAVERDEIPTRESPRRDAASLIK